MSKKDQQLISWYQDYIELLKLGKSHEEALTEFDYLHPITKSRLEHYIKGEELSGSSISQTEEGIS